MSDERVDLDALASFPTSDRIQADAHQMAAAIRRAEVVGEPRMPLPEAFEGRDHELGKIDPDPGNMSRLKVTREPREIERPESTWTAFERLTAQFFLRNTHRLERYADGSLFEYSYMSDGRLYLGQVVEILAQAAQPVGSGAGDPLASAQAYAARAEAEVLMVETHWAELFGQPDPVDD